MQKDFLARIQELSLNHQKEVMRVEEAYLNKIEWYKANESAILQEEQIKCEHRVDETRLTMQTEIDRLTVLINLYREKLSKRETESRNSLVEVKIYKEKVETVRVEFRSQITELTVEIDRLKQTIKIKEDEYLRRIRDLEENIKDLLA